MVRDRARNTLNLAKLVNLSSTPQTFQDFVGIADKDDLYRLNVSNRSSFDLALTSSGKKANKANIDVELFALKGAKTGVLRRIGKLNFNALKPSDIRRYLTRVARSSSPGKTAESINIALDTGEYYLRVHRRSGDTNYNLTLSATPETSSTPTPGLGVTPTPSPGVTPTPSPDVTPTPNPIPSQTPPIWVKQLGTSGNDYAYGVAIDSAGNAYYTGVSEAENGTRTSFVARYDANGNQLWKRNLDIEGSDIAFDIAVDGNGNYYVAGISKITTTPLVAGNDAFVAKFNSSGTELWEKSISTTGSAGIPAVDAASSIAVDNSGNVFIAGFRRALPGFNPGDAFIAKYNSNGDLVTGFGSAGIAEFSGTASDAASDLALDASGNVYITGVTNASLTTDINNPFTGGDAFVAKYNGTTGAQTWSKTLVGTVSGGGSSQDYARGIAIVGSTVYITGDTTGTLPGQNSAGGSDGFVAQYTQNSGGNIATQGWVKQFGTASLDQSQGIAADAAGNIYLTGETNAALFGGTYSGGSDAFVAKFDGAGNRLSSTLLGTAADDEAYNIKVDPTSGNVYVVGQTQGNLGGPGTKQGSYDAWIAKYQPL